MSLAEGVQGTIAFKAYSSGVITPNTEDLAPGASGAQFLRRVSSSLNLVRANYVSQEVRPDRQIFDMRLGVKHVQGDIVGELSPSTFFDFIEAIFRDTRQAGITSSQADFTSITPNVAGTLTLGSGSAVTKGFQVGDIIRLAGTVSNNAINYTILSFGSAGTVLNVTPLPVTEATVSTFTMDAIGYATSPPATSQVSRKFGIEIYDEDTTVSRLFTECRASKFQFTIPASGIVGATFSFWGRDMVSGTGSSYFTTPAAVTTTPVTAAVNGLLMLDGASVGVVTGANITCDLTGQGAGPADVVGQNFPAEIFLGRANVSGQLTAFLTDASFFGYLNNETELSMILQVSDSSSVEADAIAIYLPRFKTSSADLALTGEGGQIITANWQALRYDPSGSPTPGVPLTTIRVVDTAV